MKTIFPIFILIVIVGCTQSGTPTGQGASTSSNSPPLTTTASSDKCLTSTGSLKPVDVKSVKLSTQAVTESGQINAGRFLGYGFEAKAGQRFNFKPSDNRICVQVYTPSNKLITGNELLEDGKYIVQISIPQGNTSFSIEMGLDSLLSSTPTNSSSSSGTLTKDQALRIINNWLASKQKVFAPPWDRKMIDQFTTGPLHNDITKSDGTLAWLKKYKAYYTYKNYEINKNSDFSNSGQRPSIKTQITEDRILHTSEGNDPSQTGKNTTLTYFFALEDGIWKIYDYREES